MTAYPHPPPWVRAADLGPVTVLVNYRNGAVQALPGQAGRWWAQLAQSADPSAPDSLSLSAARLMLARLEKSGMLEYTSRPRPWQPPAQGPRWAASWGVQELPFGFCGLPRAPLASIAAACLGLPLTLAVAAAGRRSRRMLRLVRLVQRATHAARRRAEPTEIAHAVHAVRHLGLFAPVRAACLEESVAAAVTLALAGRHARWCHGAAADPVRLHAWLESTKDRAPVAEPASTQRYATLLAIDKT